MQILISAKSAPCSFRLTTASSIIPRPMPEKTDLLLRLGHSPDPDDAFMFYGLAKNKLATGRYRFEHILQDIQTLNHRHAKAISKSPQFPFTPIHTYPTSMH